MTEMISYTPKYVASLSDQDLAQIYLDQFDMFFDNDGAEEVKVVRAEVRRRGLTRDQIDSLTT